MTWHNYNILFFSHLHINSVHEWPRKPFFSVQLFHRLDFNSYSRKIFFAINQIKIIEIQNYLLTTLKILTLKRTSVETFLYKFQKYFFNLTLS